MFTLSRRTALQFHQVLRKAGLLKPVRTSSTPCLRLTAGPDGLTLQASNVQLAVSLTIAEPDEPETLQVPLAWLADCTQRTEGPVTIASRSGRLIAAWTDRGMPIEREYEPISADEPPPPWPTLPTEWAENPPTCLDALRQAMQTVDPEARRYALGCVQLQGAEGRIAATDSRQALVQSGFTFPWTDNLLIPASKVLDAPALPRDQTVRIGRTAEHVVLQVGPWTLGFTIQTEGKFPDVQRIIPTPAAVRTQLQLHPDDVEFVSERLAQLPQADDAHQSVTVDFNGSVAIRARRSPDTTATELVLRRSQREGDEVRLTNIIPTFVPIDTKPKFDQLTFNDRGCSYGKTRRAERFVRGTSRQSIPLDYS